MQLVMEVILGPLMEVISGEAMEALMPMEVMQVMDISNRTGQDTMMNSHLEEMVVTEDITLKLMFQTGTLMVMEKVMSLMMVNMEEVSMVVEEAMMSGGEIGNLDIQKEDRGETRVLDTGLGEEEVITAQRERKEELEPWKN